MSDLTISDVLDIEYPSAPTWSADGTYVAATLTGDDGAVLTIAAAADPSEPWQVDLDGEGVAAVAWAPASTPARLAVVTDDGRAALVNADRETVETLTGHADGDDLAWTSDGERVAYYRDGTPTVYHLDDGTDERFDVPERGTFLGESEMLAWGPDDRLLASRFVEFDTKQVGVVDTATGDLHWRSREQAYATTTPQWLGDGRLLVDRAGEHGTVREVVAVDTDDGTEQVLYREQNRERGTLSRGAPTVSPNGGQLALTVPDDGWEHVYVVDVDAGARTQLTAGAFEDKGLAGSRPQWRSNEELVFASNRANRGRRGIYAVDRNGETRTVVEPEGTSVYPRPSPDGDALAYVHAGQATSPELRLLDPETGETHRITHSVVDEWPIEPLTPERVTVDSVGGLEIESYLLDPREGDAVDDDATDLPAVVWVHGGPMRQMRDGWHPSRSYGLAYAFQQYLAHEGYVGLFVNYRGGIGYGADFRAALAGNRGDDEMEDIVAGAAYLRTLDYVDADAVGMWGLSYGGYAALQLLGTHPEAFDVAVNLAGLADLELYRDWAEATKYPAAASSMAVRLGGEPWEATDAWDQGSPVTHVENYENPLYSFHGTGDRYVNVEQLDLLVDELLDCDADHEWEYYPDEKHVFSQRSTWERVLPQIEAAFDEHLG
ncbi:S9 family peptidase [Halobaculum limi]|uniref:S9 family peptidase n=1 Tax=Halobaculum limi TaxID=3031916 RepID=UPI002405E76E|nr:prolyl oligopeptidase family serine peptidase [Halobaculum sp. YSMS11]